MRQLNVIFLTTRWLRRLKAETGSSLWVWSARIWLLWPTGTDSWVLHAFWATSFLTEDICFHGREIYCLLIGDTRKGEKRTKERKKGRISVMFCRIKRSIQWIVIVFTSRLPLFIVKRCVFGQESLCLPADHTWSDISLFSFDFLCVIVCRARWRAQAQAQAHSNTWCLIDKFADVALLEYLSILGHTQHTAVCGSPSFSGSFHLGFPS